ncbi:MAG: ribosomal protein S21/MRP21, partial [Deltaproteobacteria bacterium]|nr:ribosomal protein S21/MRP21 [Deltaproteobacteria bacterium]
MEPAASEAGPSRRRSRRRLMRQDASARSRPEWTGWGADVKRERARPRSCLTPHRAVARFRSSIQSRTWAVSAKGRKSRKRKRKSKRNDCMGANGMKSGPVQGRPLEVTVEGDNVDRAINRLKRKMADEGVLKEL